MLYFKTNTEKCNFEGTLGHEVEFIDCEIDVQFDKPIVDRRYRGRDERVDENRNFYYGIMNSENKKTILP